MAITYPPIYTPVVDAELEVEGPVSEETVRKFIQNINMLSKLCPVGSVVGAAINIPGCPNVDNTIFQYCDGTEITDANSPLKSTALVHHNTVNLQGVYIRGAAAENANNVVGSTSVNLVHSHGGQTGVHHEDLDPQSGSAWAVGDPDHTHTIQNDLTNANPDISSGGSGSVLDPFHYNVAFYLKIN